MTPVTKLSAHLSSLRAPSEIRTLPAWLMWRIEHHEGEDRPRKVPYYVSGARRHGRQGSTEDRQQLTTFDAARAAAARRGMDGVGLALLPEWGICALDFDKCVLPTGELHPEVAEIASQSYAEWSPSGNGVRVLFKGNLLNRKSFTGDFGFETFSTRGFVTITGNTLDVCDLMGNEDTIVEITDQVRGLYRRRFTREDGPVQGHDGEVLGLTMGDIERALEHLDPDMGHDQWLQVGMGLHHETRGEGFELWHAWSERGSKYPGRDILRHRWDSFGRHDGTPVTARTLVQMANRAGAGIGHSGPASADEFDDLVQVAGGNANGDKDLRAKTKAEVATKYVFEPVASFARADALQWWVKGVLPKAELGVVYGASGSGKSFVLLDLGMAIARGVSWRGCRVKQGRVAYIAAEGAGGFRKRLVAYGQDQGIDLAEVPMMVLGAAPNLMDAKDSAAVVAAIQAAGGADVVIVDTFAQTTPGANENAGEDVGKALAHCKRIHEASGALVLLVHHAGKDSSKGARGWSGLKAAVDTEIEIVRTETGARYMRLSKSKDDIDGLEWGFELQQVSIGMDEDGDPITSCVVREAEVNKAKAVSRKLGKNETLLNEVIQELAQAQTTGIERDAVVEEALRRLETPGDKAKDVRKNLRRALTSLCESAENYVLDDETGTIEIK